MAHGRTYLIRACHIYEWKSVRSGFHPSDIDFFELLDVAENVR
jgi:hypothetical protein